MSNSPLVKYTKLSPNCNKPRNHAIDTITPHCVVGQLSAESICGCFPAGREASCNYGIGTDGRVSLCVDEKDRSWCSSSSSNDNRAVTIECASDKAEPYAMNSKVYESLIALCVDICKRNGKNKLLWLADKTKTLNYAPKSNEMVITVHRWFANKSCPGNWLYERLGNVAAEATKRLGDSGSSVTPPPTKPSGTMYRVRKSWADSKSQIGAYSDLNNAKEAVNSHSGYKAYDINGKQVYPYAAESFNPYLIQSIADSLNIRTGPGTNYKTNGSINDKSKYTIIQESNGTGTNKWGKLKSGAGWISLDYTKRV